LRITLLLMACWTVATIPVVAQERLPVPAPAAQRQAERSLRDANKAAYASKWSSEKLALAKTLLERARKRQDDEVGQFVAYQEARQLAAQASNVDLALEAARECAARFQVAMYPLAIEALTIAGKVPRGLSELRILVHTCLRTAQEAADAEDTDSAGKAVALASNLARPLKDATLLAAVATRNNQVNETKAWLARVANARPKLQVTPDDAISHRLLGQYEALRHANWEVGLEHLASADDADLKALALRDRSAPVAADDQTALADSWWDLAEHLDGVMRQNARQRALTWYEKAAKGDVPLLGKARMSERLAALRVERLTCDWLPGDDHSFFDADQDSSFSEGCITIRPTAGFMSSVRLTRFPYDVDGVSVRVRPGQGPKVQAYLAYEPQKECVLYDRDQGLVAAAWQSKPLDWEHRIWNPPNNAAEIWMTVILVASEAVIYIDGVEIGRVPTKLRNLESISLDACLGAVQFDQIKVHRKPW